MISRSQVVRLIQLEREKAGGVRALARRWELSAPYVSDVLRGRRDPGPTILAKMGLKKAPVIPVEPNYTWSKK